MSSDKSCDEYRHRCEVRQLLKWRKQHGSGWCHEWIEAVKKTRGKAAAELLLTDVKRQFSMGNKGRDGEWL